MVTRSRIFAFVRMGRRKGFTLVELLVVLAIVALLLTIATPRYFRSLELARESALTQTLRASRDAIDRFYGDKGRYPESLEELVETRYLRSLPMDPIVESATAWAIVPPIGEVKGQVQDIKSTAPGQSLEGQPFSEF
jgi:general secretion pathway protein G